MARVKLPISAEKHDALKSGRFIQHHMSVAGMQGKTRSLMLKIRKITLANQEAPGMTITADVLNVTRDGGFLVFTFANLHHTS